MAVLEKEIGLEHLNLMQKRLEVLIGGRVINRDKMIEAAKSIDRLRRKVEGWNSVQEIRKWREKG
ncbi:hypothetical protein KKG61_07575 [bacterium]|nr:hypothetical protein [bacterium]MBU1599944.1 hypothetical protein [bacterium]